MAAVKDGWSLDDLPQQPGKVAIVTGATGGLGYETALGLARCGATTILAGRNPDRGEAALARIRREIPTARISFALVDLASLASVARFADSIGAVDILVNNAGVMAPPGRLLTADGFERQIGVNYLSHFVLTARLKDRLCAAPGGGRVVNVASLAHRRVMLDLNNLQSDKSYRPRYAYGVSKLAMLMFSLELQRRAERNGWNVRSIAAHPGWARTDIVANGMGGGSPGLRERLIERVFWMLAQSARDGALPSLYAALAPEAEGGAYYGPTGRGETRGTVGLARVYPQAADAAVAERLWAASERATGASFG